MMNSSEKNITFILYFSKEIFTWYDDEDFSYKEMFFYNLNIHIWIVLDEFYYYDVDQVEIRNEIFDYIYHI